MIKRNLTIILLFAFTTICVAQDEENEGSFIALGVNYGIDFPALDMSDRFGSNFHAGISIDFFNSQFNGAYGVEGYIMFGDNVKEDVLSSLRAENGAIYGIDGNYADVFLRQRGNYLGIYMDKVVFGRKHNRRAGLSLGAGVGIMQHKVRVQVDSNNAPQLKDEYKKGYDRHSTGPALKQSIKYLHVGKNKNLNYAFAINFTQGFTKNTRAVNFDTQMPDDERRIDLLIGVDFKWYLPIRDTRQSEEIFY